MGVGNVQVDSVQFWEKRWGEGVTESCYDNDCYLWNAVTGGRE